MLFMLPKPLGKSVLEKSVLRKDVFFKKPYAHCGLGEYALYLGTEVVECNRYLPFASINRVYKRIEMPAGMDPRMAFMGGGTYFLVVEYDDGETKQYKFPREAPLEKLLDAMQTKTTVLVGAPYDKASAFGVKED